MSDAELTRRWSKLREVMDARNLDAVLVVGSSGSCELTYLTDVNLRAGQAIFLLARSGSARLVVRGPLGGLPEDKVVPWVDSADGEAEIVFDELTRGVPQSVTDWLRDQGARAIGVNAELPGLSAALPEARFEGLADELLALRFVKSDEELAMVRRSVEIADEVFARTSEFVQAGRTPREVIAGIERFTLMRGGDFNVAEFSGSLNVVIRFNPSFNGWSEDDRPLEPGEGFTLEVSPRIHGYYSQLSYPVTVGQATDEDKRMFECLLRSREAGLREVRPGSNSERAAKAMLAVIDEYGFTAVNTDIGHMLGIALTEPRLGVDRVIEFEPGMVLVYHPIIKSPTKNWVFRGDTYLVTDSGNERLNVSPEDLLEVEV